VYDGIEVLVPFVG
jgi:hypothetical protein